MIVSGIWFTLYIEATILVAASLTLSSVKCPALIQSVILYQSLPSFPVGVGVQPGPPGIFISHPLAKCSWWSLLIDHQSDITNPLKPILSFKIVCNNLLFLVIKVSLTAL